MEFIGFFVSCLNLIVLLLGLFGMISAQYPILKLWTGKPGRIASFFMFLPVFVSLLVSIFGWLGPDRTSKPYSIMSVVAVVSSVIFSLVAGWIAEKIPSRVVSRRNLGPSCSRCGQELLTDEQVMIEQSLLVQIHQVESARQVEQRTGYRCKSCARLYCKQCLEREPFNSSGGRSCPACGGNFAYM